MRRAPHSAAFFGGVALLTVQALAAPADGLQVTTPDGRWRFAAEPPGLAVYAAGASTPIRVLRAAPLGRGAAAAVREIHLAAPRRSVLVTFDRLPELWEVSFDPEAEPLFDGYVHDYRMGEAIALPGFLNPRRIGIDQPLHDLRFDTSHAYVLARAADRADGHAVLQLLQLDVRRRIAQFVLDSQPRLAEARRVTHDGRETIEVPLLDGRTWALDFRSARAAVTGDARDGADPTD